MKRNNVIIDDINLNYYEGGSGKNMLFLHGGKLRAITFKNILEEMSKKYYVIAPDMPGYGLSDSPQSIWSFNEYALFFLKFINKIKLENITVVGYSFGGGVGYNLATCSSKVRKLILVDSAGIGPPVYKGFRKDIKRVFFYLLHMRYFVTLLTLLKEYALFTLKHIFDMKHISEIRSTCINTHYEYRKITIPTYILWAEDDNIFPLDYAKQLHKKITGSQLIIVKGNHDWVLHDSKKLLMNLKC